MSQTINVRVISMTKTYQCLCGEKITLTGTPAGIEAALKLWAKGHAGEGHGPCDAKTARRAREEKRLAQE